MKHTIALLFIIFCTMTLVAAGNLIDNPSQANDKWWSTSTMYELFVRSFKDTDGDKFGDFGGVLEKIDYLDSLGIGAIWFMPVTKKGEQPNGYDPVDYFDVDPDYGTLDQYKQIIEECHKRDIKIIFDLVINHTSNQHPFFKDALTGKKAKYRNWYVWQDNPADKTNWHETDNGWYYGYFYDKMPDLNFKNKAVREYMKDVIRFWLDMGVDGFRIDAVSVLVENGPEEKKNQPETFDYFRQIRKMIDEEYSDRDIFLVAEAEAPYIKYLGNGNDMFNAVFNFYYNKTIIRTIKKGKSKTRKGKDILTGTAEANSRDTGKTPGAFYGTLLSNHDLYAGVRPYRQFEDNMEMTRLAGAIYLTMPGIPFIYYGEELGMDTFSQSKWDRWLRNCMQWDDSTHAGFTTAEKPWNVVNENYIRFNVAAMDNDPKSILNTYRELIKIRASHKALSLGSYQSVDIHGKPAEIMTAYLRAFETKTLLVIHNFSSSKKSIKVLLEGTDFDNNLPDCNLLSGTDNKVKVSGGKISVTGIEGYGSVIIEISK